MITLKGQSVSFNIAGDRAHTFEVPTDRSQLHDKVAAALAAVEEARTAEQKVMTKRPNDRAGQLEANEAVKSAVGELYDVASVNAAATREHATERYDLAARRYSRAIEQAKAALQDAATAAQIHHHAAHSHGVGIDFRANSRAVVTAHDLSDRLDKQAALPAIDAETGRL